MNALKDTSHFNGRWQKMAAINRYCSPRASRSKMARQSSIPLEWVEPCEESDSEFDLHLNNGRLLEHFEQGSMTYRSRAFVR